MINSGRGSLRCSFAKSLHISRSLAMFVFKPNPVTGSVEWASRKDDDRAFADDIAKSQYGDMLHDTERNEKYYHAIRLAIKQVRSSGREVHVLDIGTGTGLLAMMAAKCGADQVTACEVFQPMAGIAKRIISANKLSEKISVIDKRSTEISIGADCDLKSKATLIVSELFDTDAIGEGVLPTLKHALENLVEPGCVVVPPFLQVYVQLVESEVIASWHKLNSEQISSQYGGIRLTDRMLKCVGSPSLQDLHVSELPVDGVKLLSAPIPVFNFDFTSADKILLRNSSNIPFECTESGNGNALIMWWSVNFDSEGKVQLRTAPQWAHQSQKPWRDHWLQAIQHLESPVSVKRGEPFVLSAAHDDYSMWFSVLKKAASSPVPRPACTCGAHLTWSQSRFSMLNDMDRATCYKTVLAKTISTSRGVSACLSISDGSLLPFIAASLGVKKVVCCEEVSKTHQITGQLVETNNLSNQILVLPKKAVKVAVKDFEHFIGFDRKFDMLIGEPYFFASILPWHMLFFWYARTHVDGWLSDNVKIVPQQGILRAMTVQFQDLWKLRAPVEWVEGFDLSLFDEYAETQLPVSTESKELQPQSQPICMTEPDCHALWEYPGIPLSEPIDLLQFDFTQTVPDENLTSTVTMPFTSEGVCHGLVYWMDYQLDQTTRISTGLDDIVNKGQKLQWNRHFRQAVSFFSPHIAVTSSSSCEIELNVEFNVQTGSLILEAFKK